MDLIWIGLSLFSFVLSVVTLVGYLFVLKPAAAHQEDAPILRQRIKSRRQEDVRGALVEFFRSIGDRFPGSRKEENPYRRRLLMAGYRWPSAISVYYGIKCASTLL